MFIEAQISRQKIYMLYTNCCLIYKKCMIRPLNFVQMVPRDATPSSSALEPEITPGVRFPSDRGAFHAALWMKPIAFVMHPALLIRSPLILAAAVRSTLRPNVSRDICRIYHTLWTKHLPDLILLWWIYFYRRLRLNRILIIILLGPINLLSSFVLRILPSRKQIVLDEYSILYQVLKIFLDDKGSRNYW